MMMTQVVNEAATSAALLKAIEGMINGKRPARRGKKGKVAKSTPELKATRMAANDAECIKVFTAAGYKDVQPRVNVKVYGRVKNDGTVTGWLAEGRKVKPGEKSHHVGPFALFHIDQTEEIAVPEQA